VLKCEPSCWPKGLPPRRQLEEQRDSCPLFDTDRFRRHIEAVYVRMWKRHRQGKPPESFRVSALPSQR
jgi:protein O-GlcNAc transferase